ncbi:MAG: hypothetical protein AB8I08_16870 [Sandaracinaceae bacterium]
MPNTMVYEAELSVGQVLEASTCSGDGGVASGDTILVVQAPGSRSYHDDDSCGSLASRLVIRVREGQAGRYRVQSRCYGRSRCGGQVSIRIRAARPGELDEPEPGLPGEHEPWVRLQTTAELMVAVDRGGAGGVFEARLDALPAFLLGLHVRMSPLGIAGGEAGGVLAGSARAFVSIDMIELAVGIGGGAGSLSSRLEDSDHLVEPLFGLYLRLGNLRFGYLELQFMLGTEVFEPMVFDAEARIPIDDLDLVFRGRIGFDGVVHGQAGGLVWLDTGSERELGVFLLGGFGGLFYQPVCRFGTPCLDTNWYVGPTLGTGLEWRP